MTKNHPKVLAALSLAAAGCIALAQAPASTPTPVTVDNYNRAQSDVNFAGAVKNGALGNFQHGRELTPPGKRGIIRPNRDTLYSFAVFDFDAGPVTITWPDAGKRFSGMQVVNQDQYTRAVYYGNGSYTLTRDMVGVVSPNRRKFRQAISDNISGSNGIESTT